MEEVQQGKSENELMAKCQYCGANIMKFVQKCPQCGAPSPTLNRAQYSKRFLIYVGVFVVLGIICFFVFRALI
jgi:ribosomal protein L37E